MIRPTRIYQISESAVTIEFAADATPEANSSAIEFTRKVDELAPAGVVETVPAHSSATIFFDTRALGTTPVGRVEQLVDQVLPSIRTAGRSSSDPIEIAVKFDRGGTYDLESSASDAGLSVDEFVSIFLAGSYVVRMLGFLPGFVYLGEVDARIAMPRLSTPRRVVPRGAVGIADRQTGIYSMESPGGWRVIGITEFTLFDPESFPPPRLEPGAIIRFVEIKE
ncbi:MAG: 5-oxoprolinase subunit PxpB [Acidobacteria bacterium]|nr:5-oxoprolinase subunit PxpB [Acidobacteriota bacterium]MCW5949023.1 5-oxoprolinase subunit PxpB [Pyrinomonadaceae bacterium]